MFQLRILLMIGVVSAQGMLSFVLLFAQLDISELIFFDK